MLRNLLPVFLLALLSACDRSPDPVEAPPPVPPNPDAPNVLLLSVDTLRADHLGCYGHSRDTSPVLDALAADGVRFEQAWAPTPWTLPSHAAMLTGVHPYDLGMRHKKSAIPEAAPSLAEILAAAGYRTAAFVDSSPGGYVGRQRGFARGFAEYEHAPHEEDLFYRYDMAATVDAAIDWLGTTPAPAAGEARRPFFLFLHTKSVHAVPPQTPCLDERCFPYEKPEPYRFRFVESEEADFPWKEEDMGWGQEYLWSLNRAFLDGSRDPRDFPPQEVDVLRRLYDTGIYYTDEHFGRLLEELRQRGLYEKTLIVVTSDHGEAFLEHNLLMHQEVYPQTLRVPLILHLPQRGLAEGRELPPGTVVSRPATLMDVAPTLLGLLGLPAPDGMTGRDVLVDPNVAPRGFFAYYLFPPTFSYRAFSLRHGERTVVYHNFQDVHSPAAELYDQDFDPNMTAPLLPGDETSRQQEALLEDLERRLRQPPIFEPVLVEEDEEALRQLRSVGYID